MKISTAIFWLCSAVITALSIFLRFKDLGNIPGINGDEAFLAVKAILIPDEMPYLFTPHGNLISFVNIAFQKFVHLLIPSSSFFVLRLPSAIAGTATAVLAFFFFQKPFGQRSAAMSALLIASLPIHIAYSRLAWEPSLTPIISVLCIGAALNKHSALAMIFLLIAINIHPTNIFLFPILFCIATYFVVMTPFTKKNIYIFTKFVLITVLTAASSVTLLQISHVNSLLFIAQAFSWRVEALCHNIFQYILLLSELLSGITVYKFIVGAVDSIQEKIHVYTFMLFVIPIIILGAIIQIKKGITLHTAFFGGLLISCFMFYFIAGPTALSPHTERYAIWLTVPFCLLFSISSTTVCCSFRIRYLHNLITIGFPLLLLWSFHTNFIEAFTETNSLSHPTFLSGHIEPKKQAMESISSRIESPEQTLVLVEDWWIYWPMKYLALKRKDRIEISIHNQTWSPLYPQDFKHPEKNGKEKIYVGWINGRFSKDNAFIKISDLRGYANVNILGIFVPSLQI